MTADEARSLTHAAKHPDPMKLRFALEAWNSAIEKAAKAGRNSVRETQLDRPRTPMPQSVWEAARAALHGSGFKVESVADSLNETTFEVSW